ncbi:MAG: di-trans,poly-cis-decaprenylcistransferase [Lachnospiraceae bacterium]|nr:di-trans,poly-cis-decaprenylcistransferase [Lachnospiraceae bacterium]
MEQNNQPRHIAVILDGNGRWAKKKGVPRAIGHKEGCETLKHILDTCYYKKIEFFSVYAFSTENWKRSQAEVKALIQLMRYYLPRLEKRSMERNTKVRIIGDIGGFPEDVQKIMRHLIETTAVNTGLTFIMGLNYGGRDELRRAMVKLAQRVKDGELEPEEITEAMISASLDTADIPDPDVIIRTSGEMRLSNFMTWQSAYSELEFPTVLWPDFSDADLEEAIRVYNSRDRRFGGRKEDEA